MTATITRDELAAKLDQPEAITVVEALPESYYRKAHLPGALNVPHDADEGLIRAILPDSAGEIVVYCANLPCENSGQLAARLARLGYTNVRDYAEGKQDWIDAGLPTERGIPAHVA